VAFNQGERREIRRRRRERKGPNLYNVYASVYNGQTTDEVVYSTVREVQYLKMSLKVVGETKAE
jgi:hypothetical protein